MPFAKRGAGAGKSFLSFARPLAQPNWRAWTRGAALSLVLGPSNQGIGQGVGARFPKNSAQLRELRNLRRRRKSWGVIE
jgi:hypothetical protein